MWNMITDGRESHKVIQKGLLYIVYMEIFAYILFHPFCPRCQLANITLGNSDVSNYLPLKISVSGRI